MDIDSLQTGRANEMVSFEKIAIKCNNKNATTALMV